MPISISAGVNATGSNGSILSLATLTVPPSSQTVDILISINSSNFTFTGGSPAGSVSFGSGNGRRWNGLTVDTSTNASAQYDYTNSGSTGSLYAVVVIQSGTDNVLDAWSGSIPAPGPA